MIRVFDSSHVAYLNKVELQWIFTGLDGENIIPKIYEQAVLERKARGDAES